MCHERNTVVVADCDLYLIRIIHSDVEMASDSSQKNMVPIVVGGILCIGTYKKQKAAVLQ